jgi:hypothetical protein
VGNGPAQVAAWAGLPIVGSCALEPQGLLLSKIAIGSSSDPDG